jgi:Na+-driven multidrug efflux pump
VVFLRLLQSDLYSRFLDALGWASAGILVGAGDTRSVMWINAVNAWIFALIPNYIAIHYFNTGPLTVPMISLFYLVINAAAI